MTTLRPLLGALVGGLIGMIIWATMIAAMGVESGIVAWGIGWVVGFATMMAGERSQRAALFAVGMTIVAICGGKVAGSMITMNSEVSKYVETALGMDIYEEFQTDANDFAKLSSRNQYPQFMVSHGYTGAPSADKVSPDEVGVFESRYAEHLRSFAARNPSYGEWRAETESNIRNTLSAQFSLKDHLLRTMGILDILFFALGIITAFKVVATSEAS